MLYKLFQIPSDEMMLSAVRSLMLLALLLPSEAVASLADENYQPKPDNAYIELESKVLADRLAEGRNDRKEVEYEEKMTTTEMENLVEKPKIQLVIKGINYLLIIIIHHAIIAFKEGFQCLCLANCFIKSIVIFYSIK